ncbi:hypothetical protein ACVGV4_00555, partial [Enterobacter hormaechei]
RTIAGLASGPARAGQSRPPLNKYPPKHRVGHAGNGKPIKKLRPQLPAKSVTRPNLYKPFLNKRFLIIKKKPGPQKKNLFIIVVARL